jgi:hypothetical protein
MNLIERLASMIWAVLLPWVIHATAVSRQCREPLLASPCVELRVCFFVRPLMDKQPAATLKAELWEILQVSVRRPAFGGDKSLLECLNPF